MAGAGLLALLDDITSILDDVASMTKVATSKTAGVLGDDLALNAQQVAGVNPEREIPVVWQVAKGSFKNKLILVPLALIISWLLPWLVIALLMIGGAYLCFEGVEKLYHKFFHHKQDTEDPAGLKNIISNPNAELIELEKEKIKGAIRTDFVLSAEIIVISLGTVASKSILVQLGVLSAIAVIMTIGVYGFVAVIIKMDDCGLALINQKNGFLIRLRHFAGRSLLAFAPIMLRFLSVVGTLAMFLVGGGIIVHGLPFLQQFTHGMGIIIVQVINITVGVIVGAVVLGLLEIISRYRKLSALSDC